MCKIVIKYAMYFISNKRLRTCDVIVSYIMGGIVYIYIYISYCGLAYRSNIVDSKLLNCDHPYVRNIYR